VSRRELGKKKEKRKTLLFANGSRAKNFRPNDRSAIEVRKEEQLLECRARIKRKAKQRRKGSPGGMGG